MPMDIKTWLRTSRNISNAASQAESQENQQSLRSGKYNEQYVLNPYSLKNMSADEGSYFIATNPTMGTGVAYGSAGTQTSFSDTVPFMMLFNNAAAASNIRVFLDYIKLIQFSGTAPASTTSVQAAVKTSSVTRLNTAGTLTTITPVSPNQDSSASANSRLYVPAGAVATIPADSAGRLIGRAQLKGGPTLLLDEYNINFGFDDMPSSGAYLTTVSSYQTRMGPVVLGPQQWAVIHLWLPGGATNPFTFEFEVGVRER